MDANTMEILTELLILKGRVEALKAFLKNNEYLAKKEVLAILGASNEERSE